jgi:hypothetical protein
MSYVKTMFIAVGLAVSTAAMALIELGGQDWPGHVLQWAAAVVAIGSTVVAMAGLIVLRRDADIANARLDLFARANRHRSEAALSAEKKNDVRGWLPSIWRVLTRHGRPVVGDLVRVKPLEQIRKTLDVDNRLDGLPFMPEMAKHCGKTLRVYRSVDKIYDYGGAKNLRRMNAAALLTGVRCDGSAHDGCQAECYLIWKTAWLERVSDRQGFGQAPMPRFDDERELSSRGPAVAESSKKRRYACQFTALAGATSPMSVRDPRQDLRPLLDGNVSIIAAAIALLTRLFNRIQRIRGGACYPHLPAATQRSSLAAQPLETGDLVQVRAPDAIAATLDSRGRHRGLWFDAEMLKYCGRRARIAKRVERIIDDASGKMLEMKEPCFVLEGVQASGEFLRFCPQEELIYWREAWLTPIVRE